MIPPKYNFYIGAIANIYISSGRTIDDNGNIVSSDYEQYASSKTSLYGKKYVFINLISQDYKNAIFFYDKSSACISYKSLDADSNNTVIQVPDNAMYYALRFSTNDANFAAKKDTNFIYTLSVVNPHYKELNKKYSKESGQEFFRISLDGKINLFGSDYELIYNSNLEDQMIFIIDKYNTVSNKWVEYYKGEFNKTDCKFDNEKKSCELKTNALDEYTDVMNKYENTYDLIKLAPAISKISLHKRSLIQVYIRGASSISNFFGGIYWEDDVNSAVDDNDSLVNKYYFSYIKAANEFYIRAASISDVNGVYAGTNGYWSKWNPGYTCKMELVDGSSTMYWVRIYRNSDDVLVYQSEKQWTVSDPNNKYIEREDVVMINVNDTNDRFTIVSPFVYHIYMRLLCDVDTVTDSEGVKHTYNLPSDDFVTNNRNYKKCIGLTSGLLFCTSRAVDEPTKYGLNDYGQYFTNQFIPVSAGLERPLPVSRNSWANASLWYVYDSYYSSYEKDLRKQYILRDSYSIAAVIDALLKKIDPTLKHEATAEYSHFLYDKTVPIPMMTRFYVYMTQKTNILKGEYDQPAQKAEISLEDVMKMLRDCFRCYWYIEDNKLKIEHISFFMKGGSYSYDANIQLDFTKLTDQFNKKLSSYFQSEVEYDKTELNQRYEFNWMDDVTDLFGGVTIDVNSNYVQKDKTEEININKFSSDVDYMLFNPSSFSDDGFALLCPIKKGSLLELPIIETRLRDENNDTYNATIQNFYASWIYLIDFYMHDMPAKYLECNVISPLVARDIKMCMKHTIEFPIKEDLDKFQLIKTTIGNGKIDEVSINMDNRLAKVRLLYKPQ